MFMGINSDMLLKIHFTKFPLVSVWSLVFGYHSGPRNLGKKLAWFVLREFSPVGAVKQKPMHNIAMGFEWLMIMHEAIPYTLDL